MTQQAPIHDVVLRCRSCGVQVSATKADQMCESFQCKLRESLTLTANRWHGWEIAHITRAEAA